MDSTSTVHQNAIIDITLYTNLTKLLDKIYERFGDVEKKFIISSSHKYMIYDFDDEGELQVYNQSLYKFCFFPTFGELNIENSELFSMYENIWGTPLAYYSSKNDTSKLSKYISDNNLIYAKDQLYKWGCSTAVGRTDREDNYYGAIFTIISKQGGPFFASMYGDNCGYMACVIMQNNATVDENMRISDN